MSKTGKVYLVGAGPGDPDLLTPKAVRAIQEAEVILYDDLVNPQVLQHARGDVRLISVGKRGGCRSTPQGFIERLMLRYARAGRTVARVKGGDPFVFGRGGEEMLTLQAAGITVEIVPGMTSGLAVPALARIPVTHRGLSRGVTLVTGHTGDGSEPNWSALAQSGTTLVIYMGLARLASISNALVTAGMSSDTPAAAIQDGTLSSQHCVVTNLSALPAQVQRAQLRSPAIVVVGDVVQFAQGQQRQSDTQIAAA